MLSVVDSALMAGVGKCDDGGCDVSDAGHNEEKERFKHQTLTKLFIVKMIRKMFSFPK